MKLIIQIPCYNEEETLELAYNDLPRHIDGIDTIEYLIINDGSKDNTVQKARELGFHHVVSFRRNKGLDWMPACGWVQTLSSTQTPTTSTAAQISKSWYARSWSARRIW